MLLIRSVIHLEPKPPATFSISLTIPVRPAAFPIFNPLIATATSSSEMRQWGPITSGQSTSPSQSFSTFRSFYIYFLHIFFIPSASDTTFLASFFIHAVWRERESGIIAFSSGREFSAGHSRTRDHFSINLNHL